ncbi:hypothetical protein P154DRAFT_536872 [Amniculicola lignicola CBS 123094]|uniref:Uncharacterized protein n=1 Tax=Amniculicola lignicola CBS 123094 TaxID=1392246 RepID=A0A6A5WCG4_9PLEO|nr:hypothetical protein P154DRAFT_536872 [Amniculicola lignicola CBS 123094]
MFAVDITLINGHADVVRNPKPNPPYFSILTSIALETQIEAAMNSAFKFADDGWDMIYDAQNYRPVGDEEIDQKNEATNAAVKGHAKRMFGDEKYLWTDIKKSGSMKHDLDSVRERFWRIKHNVRVRTKSTDPGIPTTMEDYNNVGWLKKLSSDEIVIYCGFNNQEQYSHIKAPVIFDKQNDKIFNQTFGADNHDLDGDVAGSGKTGMDRCAFPDLTSDWVTQGLTYSAYFIDDQTRAARPTQIFLCASHLEKISKKKFYFSSEAFLKEIGTGQFRGDPKTFKKKFRSIIKAFSEKPKPSVDIVEYYPVHQVLLHELFHVPGHGKADDADRPCYGWKNCAALASDPKEAVSNADTLALFALALFWERNGVCVTNRGNLIERNDKHKCETEPPLDELEKDWDERRAKAAKEDEENRKKEEEAKKEGEDDGVRVTLAKEVPFEPPGDK